MKPPKYERGGRLKVKIHVFFLIKIAHDHGTDIIQLSVEFCKHLSKLFTFLSVCPSVRLNKF